jgi:hypothetical protein
MTTDFDLDAVYISYSNSAPQELPKFLFNRQVNHDKLNRFCIGHNKTRTVFLYLSSKIEPSLLPYDKDGNLYFNHEIIACPSERTPSNHYTRDLVHQSWSLPRAHV